MRKICLTNRIAAIIRRRVAHCDIWKVGFGWEITKTARYLAEFFEWPQLKRKAHARRHKNVTETDPIGS